MNFNKRAMDIHKEIYNHNSSFGVLYVQDGAGNLILASGRKCSESDYKMIPGTNRIAKAAFWNCVAIASIDMSATMLTSIDAGTFGTCRNLTKIELPEGLESIGEWAFDRCPIAELDLPDSLKTIKEGAFSSNKVVREIIMPLGLTEIESMAFQFCNELTSVFLPSSVVKIGKYAFWGCDKLSAILVQQDSDVNRIKKLLPSKMRKFVKFISK